MLIIAIVELYTRWYKSIKDVPKFSRGSGRRPHGRGCPALGLGAAGMGQEGREGGRMRSCLGFPAPSSRCRPTQIVNKRWCFYQNIPSPFRRRECGGFLSVLKNHGSLFWETLLNSLPDIHFPFLLYPQNPNFVHDSIVVAENLDFLVARGGHMTRPDQ